MKDILDYDIEELHTVLKKLNLKKFKIGIIIDWIYKKFIFDFEKMSNLSKSERRLLNNNFNIIVLNYVKSIFSKDKKTEKFLFKTRDDYFVETVLIKSKKRNTICVSSQIGCALNCSFCATGKLGFKRNLSTAEILFQILYVTAKIFNDNERITNIVFMGMGEPLLNYDSVLKSIKMINNEKTLNLGSRHITISTSGIIEGIKKLSNIRLQIRLAVSLNSPFQNVREKLMPVTKNNRLVDLIKILKLFQNKKNKKITFEYVLMKNLNMAEKDAEKLSVILKHFVYNLNIIKYNPIYEKDDKLPNENDIENFIKLLRKYNINFTQRFSKGKEIAAGCGQLGLLNKSINSADN